MMRRGHTILFIELMKVGNGVVHEKPYHHYIMI